jgi:phytanoyl-CoA hydroxylase
MFPESLKTEYDENGYILIRSFFSSDEVHAILKELERVIKENQDTMGERAFYEDITKPHTLKQIQKVFELDPYFDDVFFKSRFAELASHLLGEKAKGENMQFFNKPAGAGMPTPPHQDGWYFMLNPCSALTMWFALDFADEQNGCVRYIARSHKDGMRAHGKTGTLGFSQGLLDFPAPGDDENEVSFEVQPGDLLVHDALTVHWAEGNSSATRSRKALGFIYYGESAKVDKEAAEAYKQKLYDGLKTAGKI